jgi:hypothetical protein
LAQHHFEHAPSDLPALLLVVPNPVHGVLDPEPDLDDLLHGGHRIGHVLLHSAESQEQKEIKKLFPSREKMDWFFSPI